MRKAGVGWRVRACVAERREMRVGVVITDGELQCVRRKMGAFRKVIE